MSASDAAATIRPSASTSGSGELCRSSAHSSATFFGLCRARWQSISTGRCSAESLKPPERLQVAGRRAPAAAPVGGQAGQLPHGGHAGRLVGHRLDGPERILEAPPLVGAVGRLGPLDQLFPVAGGGDVGGVADLGGDLGGEGVAPGQRGDRLRGTGGAPGRGAFERPAVGRSGGLAPSGLPRARGASVSSHSRAPSSRSQRAPGSAPGVPRRRSRSSGSSAPRSSLVPAADLWAPRRATLPHRPPGAAAPAVLLGCAVRPLASHSVQRWCLGRGRRGASLGPGPVFPASLVTRASPGGAGRGGSPDPPVVARLEAPGLGRRLGPADRGAPDLGLSAVAGGPGPARLTGAPPGRSRSIGGRSPSTPGTRSCHWRRRSSSAFPRPVPAAPLLRLAAPPALAGRRVAPPAPPDLVLRSAPPLELPRGPGRPPAPARCSASPLSASTRPRRMRRPTRSRRRGATIRLGGVPGHLAILGVSVVGTPVAKRAHVLHVARSFGCTSS